MRAAPSGGLLACALVGALLLRHLRAPQPAGRPAVECGFYPDELCSALAQGKGAASLVARLCGIPPPAPRVPRAPGNCSRLARALRLVDAPLSAAERSEPLAYIIGVRKEPAMLLRLFPAIYGPQNIYCVHVDDRAPKECGAAARGLARCLENVFVAAGGTRVQAELRCMRELLRRGSWRHAINLCGQDFPLKTNGEVVRFIRSRGGRNVTPGGARIPPGLPAGSPPPNVTVYSGSAHYVLTREFVEFVLTDARAKDLLQWSRHVQNPERYYWVTLNRLKDAPGAAPEADTNIGWEGNLRAVKRRAEEGTGHDGCKGHYEEDTCVFGPGDLPWIMQSPALFASKFEPSTDPLVVMCLERWLRLKALRQAEVPIEPHWHFPRESHFNL